MIYPQSHPIHDDPMSLIDRIAQNRADCASFYLDTTQNESKSVLHEEDHHQGLARTHRLSDGSVYWFLSHSVIGGQGKLMQFRYPGPLDGEHVLSTHPPTVAALTQTLHLQEEHPSDICFLPDIDDRDAGYLFVAEEFGMRRLAVYAWQPGADLTPLGYVTHRFENVGATVDLQGRVVARDGPNFVFIDRVADRYVLGLCNNNVQECALFTAPSADLFPTAQAGGMDIAAFQRIRPAITYPFPPTGGPSQAKLIRSIKDQWWLLAYRCDPNDSENGDDYIDVHPVRFHPAFLIGDRIYTRHIFFPGGDTSFASTGTHHVEPGGRLLVSSSYRWAEDGGPGSSSYVTRVDELPSSP